jgi:hypothetical protein
MSRGSNKEGTKEEEARSIGTTYVGQKSVQERVDARVGLALDIDNEPVLRERTGLWRDPETTDNGWLGGGTYGVGGLEVVVVGQLVENEGGEEVDLGLLGRGRLGHEETEPDLRCVVSCRVSV